MNNLCILKNKQKSRATWWFLVKIPCYCFPDMMGPCACEPRNRPSQVTRLYWHLPTLPPDKTYRCATGLAGYC